MIDECLYLKNREVKLLVKKNESFVFYATFIAGEYNRLKIVPGDTVIDFGANIGDFTVKAGKTLKDKGRLIALEPNHKNITILKRNIEINNIKNVEIFEYAVTDKDGYSYLKGDDVAAEVSEENVKGDIVKTISVESLMDKLGLPDKFKVKMDIEGAEKFFFKNEKFVNSIEEIALEIHGMENINNIKKILRNKEFVVTEFNSKMQFKNTLKSMLLDPINFIVCEKKSGFIASKGAFRTLLGKNPIPSVNNKELIVIHAGKELTQDNNAV